MKMKVIYVKNAIHPVKPVVMKNFVIPVQMDHFMNLQNIVDAKVLIWTNKYNSYNNVNVKNHIFN